MISHNGGKIAALRAEYARLKNAIGARLGEFEALYKTGTDSALFTEMCFCACTPQNDAHKAWDAVTALGRAKLLTRGTREQIAVALREGGVRFHNNKAAYIVKNREAFLPGLKKRVDAMLEEGLPAARCRLAALVSGWGLKEASHFLRNTGHGDVCILDRHILRKLAEFGAIPRVPQTLPAALYLEIEGAMKTFARRADIPVPALDLLFWHEAKGEIFK